MCKVPEEVVLTSGHQIMTGHNKIIDTMISDLPQARHQKFSCRKSHKTSISLSNFPPLENELIVA